MRERLNSSATSAVGSLSRVRRVNTGVTELFPILATTDLERALGFYRDVLGGAVTFSYPGPDGGVVYVGIDLGSSHLGVGLDAVVEPAPRPRAISLWVYTDDCDALVERVR